MQSSRTAALAVLSLVAASPHGSAQSDAEALGHFRAAFAAKTDEKTAPDKFAAITELTAHPSPAAVEAVIRAYVALEREGSPIEAKRAAGLQKGGGQTLADERRALRPIRRLQQELLDLLRTQREPSAVRAQIELLLQPPLPLTLELTLARRAGDLAIDDVDLVLQQTTDRANDRKVDRRRLLLVTLERLGERARPAAAWVIAQLDDADEVVRRCAASALQSLHAPASLEPLVARLEHENGRTLQHFVAVLCHLTGQSPGATATSWQLWLHDHGAPYIRGETPLGALATTPADAATPLAPDATGSYFGIPQDGHSIVYVFDNSESMNQPVARGDRSRRIDACKEEIRRALQQLAKTKRFNVIAFANELRCYAKKMTPATPKNIRRAEKWLDAVELEYATNGYDALELAFAMAGRGTQDRYYELEADTIFFLSDGAPTTAAPPGENGVRKDAIADILAAVRRWNPYRRVTIHTVGLGLDDNELGTRARGFLRQLATQNGGQFIEPQ